MEAHLWYLTVSITALIGWDTEFPRSKGTVCPMVSLYGVPRMADRPHIELLGPCGSSPCTLLDTSVAEIEYLYKVGAYLF